jgi:type III pantothenate kinase
MKRSRVLLLDIGNTHTHVGVSTTERIIRAFNLPTKNWFNGRFERKLRQALGAVSLAGAAICSVVPRATPLAVRLVTRCWITTPYVLTDTTVPGLGIDYPKPGTIGPDRLANALAVSQLYGAPAVVVDFGTAVTFDVVDVRRYYVGGIIAPGLSAMTSYLHEKTALLPEIKIREVDSVIGKSTTEAMLIGAVHGYRGLIRELILELKRALKCRRLPVIATGGYAALIAAKLPEITSVKPDLTLEGLRLAWLDSPLGP